MSTQTILIITKVIREIISSRINVGLRYFIVLENAWTLWFLLGKHKNNLLNTPLHPIPPPPTSTQTRIQYIYVHLFMFWLEISNDTKAPCLVLTHWPNRHWWSSTSFHIITIYCILLTENKYTQVPTPCAVLVESSPTTAWVINHRMCNKIYLLRVPFFNH